MRRPLLSVAAALALAGCPSSDGGGPPPGRDVGQACTSAGECRAGLVCSTGLCAAIYYRPALSCLAPRFVAGAPIVAPNPGPFGCVTAVRAPVVFPPGEIADLGEFAVGDPAIFEVPAGTSAFSVVSQEVGESAADTIVYQGYALPNTVVPTEVRLPAGTLFFSDTDPLPSDGGYADPAVALAYYAGFTPVMGAFTIPNTSAALDLVRSAGEVPRGPWTFQVNDWARECLDIPGCAGGSTSGRYRVQVITHPGALRSNGTLDLEIYLATSSRTAVDAASSPGVARMIRSLGAYYAQVGICIGDVTFHDLPDWAKLRYAENGVVSVSGNPPCDDLSQLFTLALAQENAVHLFLADELDAGPQTGGRTVLGVDGAIPGPSGVPGTITSGAIVGLFDLVDEELSPGGCTSEAPNLSGCGADILAYVAAHEAGHWLGLYHTTEATGDTFDPLGDTARCPCLSCAPLPSRGACSELGLSQDPPIMEARTCAAAGDGCGGGKNLMFWLLDDAVSSGDLTSQQGEVMRLNPAVQ